MQVQIRYRVHAERVAEVIDGIADTYAELEALQPDWIDQRSFQLDDPQEFLAIVELDDPGRLSELAVFQRHRTLLNDACEQPPVTTVLKPLGAYKPGRT